MKVDADKAAADDDDEYEWVYYNAMDCRDCSQANQVFGANAQPCDEEEEVNGALGAEFMQEWEYYDEMPVEDEEFFYDTRLHEIIPKESFG